MRGPMKAPVKYYVVIHGKCPGIYDSWERVQSNISDFQGSEYSSKPTKAEAIELFHEKRPDWPKHNIPDFTFKPSNRLTPIQSNNNTGGSRRPSQINALNSAKSLPAHSTDVYFDERRSNHAKHRSNSLEPKVSDISGPESFESHYHSNLGDSHSHLDLPHAGSDPRFRPEKIVLQQNWLGDSKPKSPLPGYGRPVQLTPTPRTPRPSLANGHFGLQPTAALSRSNSFNGAEHFGSTLGIPQREEFRRQSGRGEWSSIGVRSPIPTKHREDLNLPAINNGMLGADLAQNRRSGSEIELFPHPGNLAPSSSLGSDELSITLTDDSDRSDHANPSSRNALNADAGRKKNKKKTKTKQRSKSHADQGRSRNPSKNTRDKSQQPAPKGTRWVVYQPKEEGQRRAVEEIAQKTPSQRQVTHSANLAMSSMNTPPNFSGSPASLAQQAQGVGLQQMLTSFVDKNGDILQNAALLAYLKQGDDAKPFLETITAAKICVDVYKRLSSDDEIDAARNQAILNIAKYCKDHPRARQNELQQKIQEEIEIFKDKINKL